MYATGNLEHLTIILNKKSKESIISNKKLSDPNPKKET